MPLSSAEAAKAGLVCVPSVVTGAVPFVNLPGVPRGQLKLTGELLAQIFLGKVEIHVPAERAAEAKALVEEMDRNVN